jgi:hypothetical protein
MGHRAVSPARDTTDFWFATEAYERSLLVHDGDDQKAYQRQLQQTHEQASDYKTFHGDFPLLNQSHHLEGMWRLLPEGPIRQARCL